MGRIWSEKGARAFHLDSVLSLYGLYCCFCCQRKDPESLGLDIYSGLCAAFQ